MAQSPAMNVMRAAVEKAGRALRRDFGEVENLQVSKKGPGDFVSQADLKAEKILFEELSEARPGYGFLMEEHGAVKGADTTHRWIIDPLDGTTNFLHGIPHFAISVALEREGTLVAGVIYNPITDELFFGERGPGAYGPSGRLRVAARNRLSDTIIASGMPYKESSKRPEWQDKIIALSNDVGDIRTFGSAALDLAYVAAGRVDGYVETELGAWDLAAGIVLVREAGGLVSDHSNRQRMLDEGAIVAGNETVHAELLKTI
ncbi:MAG: inositol monophosphatase [Alphaproteobacteria bacterium]|nr:inositol monophosphatase [Alphaproteobacteria bacterium]